MLKKNKMKKILVTVLIMNITNLLFAQTNYTPTGTWKWISNNDTIEMYFKLDVIHVGSKNYPVVIGFHKYIKNGILIENTLQFSNTNYSSNKFTTVIYNNDPTNSRLSGNFNDLTINTRRLIILTKLAFTSMSVRITSKEGRKNYSWLGYTLPRNFVLTKQ
jgi:hypothetical protein